MLDEFRSLFNIMTDEDLLIVTVVIEVLKTPFGNIKMRLDEKDIVYEARSVKCDDRLYPDVDGLFLVSFKFIPDGNTHELQCILENAEYLAYPETGERLEAVAFYINQGKITIGCEGDFGEVLEFRTYDFDGMLLENGIQVDIDTFTKEQEFQFGVCWLLHCTDENNVQTWYGADPTIGTN